MVLSLKFPKNVSCIIQILVSNIFETDVIQKIIINSDNIKNFIAERKHIYNYYHNYLKY